MNWPNIRVCATLAGASLPGSYLLNEISSLLLIAIVEIHPFPLSTELNLRSDRKIVEGSGGRDPDGLALGQALRTRFAPMRL